MFNFMIDIKFLRENPQAVKENIKKKFQDEKIALVDEVILLDAESRKTQQEADDLRADRNRISKEIGKLMGQALPSARACHCRMSASARWDVRFREWSAFTVSRARWAARFI